MKDGQIVKRISKKRIKMAKVVYSSGGSPEEYVDLDLLKKLKVKKTKYGWTAEIPRSHKILNIKDIKDNISLLFMHSKDGDLGTIEKVVRGDIYPITYTSSQNLLIQAYRRLSENKIWNIDCGDIGGKTDALKSVILSYRGANPGRKIFVLVPTLGEMDPYKNLCGIECICPPMRNLIKFNKKHKNCDSCIPVLFSDNIKNVEKKIRNMYNFEYRGGFYGNFGTDL